MKVDHVLLPSNNQVDEDEELDHSIVWKLLAVEDHYLADDEHSKVREVGEGHLVEEVEVEHLMQEMKVEAEHLMEEVEAEVEHLMKEAEVEAEHLMEDIEVATEVEHLMREVGEEHQVADHQIQTGHLHKEGEEDGVA